MASCRAGTDSERIGPTWWVNWAREGEVPSTEDTVQRMEDGEQGGRSGVPIWTELVLSGRMLDWSWGSFEV